MNPYEPNQQALTAQFWPLNHGTGRWNRPDDQQPLRIITLHHVRCIENIDLTTFVIKYDTGCPHGIIFEES